MDEDLPMRSPRLVPALGIGSGPAPSWRRAWCRLATSLLGAAALATTVLGCSEDAAAGPGAAAAGGAGAASGTDASWGDAAGASGGQGGAAGSGGSGGSYPTPSQWEPAAALSLTVQDGLRPRVAMDAAGSAHVVWDQKDGQPGSVLARTAYAKGSGGVFGPMEWVSESSAAHCWNAAVAESAGTVHVVWSSQSAGPDTEEVYYRARSSGGWGSAINVSNTAAKSLRPAVAATSAGGLFVGWDEATLGLDNYDVWFVAWTGSGFGAIEDVSQNPGGQVYGSVHSRIVVDPSGDPIVVWSDSMPGGGPYFVHARRRQAGAWQPTEQVSTLGTGLIRPGAAVGPDGSVHVVYRSGSSLFHQVRSGGLWSAPAALPPDPVKPLERAAVAVDDNGVAHVVAEDNSYGDGEVYYTHDASGDWSGWLDISNTPGSSSLNAEIAYGHGELVVVWQDDAAGDYDIWQAHCH